MLPEPRRNRVHGIVGVVVKSVSAMQSETGGSLSNNLAAQLSILAIVVIVLLHGHANNVVHTIASRLG